MQVSVDADGVHDAAGQIETAAVIAAQFGVEHGQVEGRIEGNERNRGGPEPSQMAAGFVNDLRGGPAMGARVVRRDAVQGGGGDVDAGVSEPVPCFDLRFPPVRLGFTPRAAAVRCLE